MRDYLHHGSSAVHVGPYILDYGSGCRTDYIAPGLRWRTPGFFLYWVLMIAATLQPVGRSPRAVSYTDGRSTDVRAVAPLPSLDGSCHHARDSPPVGRSIMQFATA